MRRAGVLIHLKKKGKNEKNKEKKREEER